MGRNCVRLIRPHSLDGHHTPKYLVDRNHHSGTGTRHRGRGLDLEWLEGPQKCNSYQGLQITVTPAAAAAERDTLNITTEA